MTHLNRVQLMGRLGEDPALKQMGDQKMVTLDMSTTESWRDTSGERRESTVWHQIEFAGRLAEIVAAGGYKGARVLLEGALVTESLVDAEGRNRRAALIKAKSMQFLDPRRAAEIKPAPASQDPAVHAQQTAHAGRIPAAVDEQADAEQHAPVAAQASAAPAPTPFAAPVADPAAAPVASAPAVAVSSTPARRFVRPGAAPAPTQVSAPATAPAAAPLAATAAARPATPTPAPVPAATAAPVAPARRFVRPGTAAAAAPVSNPVASRAPTPAPVSAPAAAAPAAQSPAATPAAPGAQPRRTWGRGINRAAAAANA